MSFGVGDWEKYFEYYKMDMNAVEKGVGLSPSVSRCLHDSCTMCHGTGVKADGSMCIHMISCPCPKCTPR